MSIPHSIFSTPPQLAKLQQIIINFLRLPFSKDSIPGNLLEAALGYVHNADVLRTYDFVDVLSKVQKIGWQVKSTKADTPVTWVRAKIPNSILLIDGSNKDAAGRKSLGDAIIDFCNAKALDSLTKYELEQIGYSRLILFSEGHITYFEKHLIDSKNTRLFNPNDYEWHWSTPKVTKKKEQLPAFVGTHKATNIKHFAWHGLGENQLHFSGENVWWPPIGDSHRLDFDIPSNDHKVNFEEIAEWLAQLPIDSSLETNVDPIASANNGGTALPT